MHTSRFLQALGGLTLAAFLLVAFTPLAAVLASRGGIDPRLERADAIVVLGGGMHPDGQLGTASLARTIRGIEIYRLGFAPILLLLGPQRHPGLPAEAIVRERLALALGADGAGIITEARGRTTREEAALSADVLGPLGGRRILLVSGTAHLPRALRLFEDAGFQVLTVPANDYAVRPGSPGGRLRLMQRVLEEQAARIYYRVVGYL